MRDRDPINWSIPLPWRPLGVTLRVHVLFFVVAVGVVLGVATSKQFAPGLWAQACVVLGLLFAMVLLHEMGHVVGSRRADGDAVEVLLWPLGGLTFPDVPRTPRAYFLTALAGPLVNLFLAAAAGGALVALGFIPPLNPLASPLNPRLHSWQEGVTYFTRANPGEAENWKFIDPETHLPHKVDVLFEKPLKGGPPVIRDSEPPVALTGDKVVLKDKREVEVVRAQLTRWPWLLAQFFMVNWFLVVVNLLPAIPLDGGRFLQSFFWRKADYRQATASAAYVGFLVMLLVGVFAIAVNELLPAILALVIYVQCRRQLYQLEEAEEKAAASYDFSQGYTSLERDENEDEPPPALPPPKMTWVQRWLQRRTERRLQRERAKREADERRLDELLDKIHREGKQALNDEELNFLTRMSSRSSRK